MPETMYDRIKSMTPAELQQLIYWVYMCGNKDGQNREQDSPFGYFGDIFLHENPDKLMPNGIDDLWGLYEKGEV